MEFRATQLRAGWKIERLVEGCSKCGSRERWETIAYMYNILPFDEQGQLANSIADVLNRAQEAR